MSYNVLLYGATGFTGRLIAAEGRRTGMSRGADGRFRMILAARDKRKLRVVADANFMDYRVFDLRREDLILRALRDVDVVINAAGPFVHTAQILAQGAIDARCHYVDVNGEIDVYLALSRLHNEAARRDIALVSSAGTSAAASDVMLDLALQHLQSPDNAQQHRKLGSVRIAVSQVGTLSRGSFETIIRSLRRRVAVVRATEVPVSPGVRGERMVVRQEPIGLLERCFDYGSQRHATNSLAPSNSARISAAANLVDTIAALHTLRRRGTLARAVESYVPLGAIERVAYQVGGTLSVFAALPWLRRIAKAQLRFLPEGPSREELESGTHVIVLEIEDVFSKRLIDWRLATPNVYQFTAQFVVAAARQVAHRQTSAKVVGFATPAHALALTDIHESEAFRGCLLDRRTA